MSTKQHKFMEVPLSVSNPLPNNGHFELEADWKFDFGGNSKLKVSKRFFFAIGCSVNQ